MAAADAVMKTTTVRLGTGQGHGTGPPAAGQRALLPGDTRASKGATSTAHQMDPGVEAAEEAAEEVGVVDETRAHGSSGTISDATQKEAEVPAEVEEVEEADPHQETAVLGEPTPTEARFLRISLTPGKTGGITRVLEREGTTPIPFTAASAPRRNSTATTRSGVPAQLSKKRQPQPPARSATRTL
tara:strand:- start:4706 stop:5263 length:558 start_codon:yes stop_codon:yes gene_type:complete